GEMAAGLAHEIRSPLAVLADPEAEADVELDKVIVHEIHRLDRVVGTFLDYARPSTCQARMNDVEKFVRDCTDAISRQHRNDEVELSVDIKDEIPPITADADQLERVITNVIENAYEALAGAGRIRVGVRTADADSELEDSVEISVQDNGPGMDDDTLQRVFIPFFTTKDSGTGLGLALCEKFVRSQEGTIQISSKLGEGTLVRIFLPRCLGGESEAA
ncbi:MAG: ATP-binding protein, partial [Deltaproteobacteria bacterium]|nr:ATP-binding protein [Deltaproteobacteria bacterium]